MPIFFLGVFECFLRQIVWVDSPILSLVVFFIFYYVKQVRIVDRMMSYAGKMIEMVLFTHATS